MLSKLMITVGILGMALALIYFVIADKTEGHEYEVVANTKLVFLVSAALVPAAYILRFLANLFGVGYGRCRKCGKRIEKQEMFCFDHSIEAIHNAKERTRFSDIRPKPRS